MTLDDLTRDDYMILICAAMCTDDPPVVTRARYKKLSELALVRSIVEIGETHVTIRTTPDGRDVALDYVGEYCKEES